MEKFSNEDSLRVITSMIEATKKDLRDNGFWYLFWGWLVFIACVLNFTLMQLGVEQAQMAWLLMLFGGVYTFIRGRKEEREHQVKTHVDHFMKYVLICFMVCLLLVLFSQGHLQMSTYPMVMMVYGMWLFMSGGMLEFRPLLIGGIINWALAFVGFYLSYEYQLLALGASVLFGYIIPGYMLRSRYNKAEKSNLANA